ncbi:DegV family protein [Secundilactobacillus collinoides]|uniref:DegV family protein n=2 Tax=Secundilactobacillus collinoides TaxID=33960 RepID=A0A0R2B7E9_SECCO|nr:DegV family protein [Secundilactobacillus collinoides]KRM75249.1 DegV family protein [Secundilactobacillus collinoides DSM 20515 = JCM 1123]KZL35884.1 DegV family protein [Secundilactobacillus collinoides]
MNSRIGLLVDSAADVPLEVLTANDNIEVVPLTLMIGDVQYLDRETITPSVFYEKQAASDSMPQTASPSIGEVQQRIERLKQRGYDKIIGITISSGLSVTNTVFNHAATVSQDATVTIIDTKSIGIGAGLQAAFAEKCIRAGLDYDTVVKAVEDSVTQSHVYFYIPTLKYLRAGGRIGRVAGLVGTMLSIRPVISCDEQGIYYPVAKARTENKAVAKMIALALSHCESGTPFQIAVTQGANPELLNQVVHTLETKLPGQPILTGDVSPALGVHTGPGLVGMAVQVGALPH